MQARHTASKKALFSGSGIAGLLLAAWTVPVFASSGHDARCPEADADAKIRAAELISPALTIPALTIEVTEHGVDSSADIDEEIVDSPRLTPSADSEEVVREVDPTTAPRNETLPTATRLPGVSDSNLPRFRRQMYRTDI